MPENIKNQLGWHGCATHCGSNEIWITKNPFLTKGKYLAFDIVPCIRLLQHLCNSSSFEKHWGCSANPYSSYLPTVQWWW